MDEKKDIETKIKENFDGLNKPAPPHIWDNLNKQLNIDRTWQRIDKKLDRRSGIIYRRKIASIAALLLLLLGGTIYLFKNKSGQFTYITELTNKQEQKNPNKSAIAENNNFKKEKNRNDKPEPLVQAQSSKKGKANPVIIMQNNDIPQNFTSQQFNKNKGIVNNNPSRNLIEKTMENDSLSFISIMPVKSIFVANPERNDTVLPNLCVSSDSNLTATISIRKKGFEIGTTYSYNNIWIINNDTRNSFDENSLIQTTPTYAGSYGLVANYNISVNSSVSTEFYINSKYIQEYDEFIEGRFTNKATEFNYYKLTLLYQFNINQSPYKTIPSKYTFKAGVYGASLKNHKQYFNRIYISETDKFTATDYGVKLAIGEEKKFGHIIVGYGINGEYGLKNIFDGNSQMPSQFNVTNNALIGGYVILKYGL